MRKAITEFWQKEFGIFYHPNQIKEFFSKDGFKTTPVEQREVYEKRRNQEEFVKLLKQVEMFNNATMDEEERRILYEDLTKK